MYHTSSSVYVNNYFNLFFLGWHAVTYAAILTLYIKDHHYVIDRCASRLASRGDQGGASRGRAVWRAGIIYSRAGCA